MATAVSVHVRRSRGARPASRRSTTRHPARARRCAAVVGPATASTSTVIAIAHDLMAERRLVGRHRRANDGETGRAARICGAQGARRCAVAATDAVPDQPTGDGPARGIAHGPQPPSALAGTYVLGPGDGAAVWQVGTYWRVLADGERTGGRQCVFEELCPQGLVAPEHVHRRLAHPTPGHHTGGLPRRGDPPGPAHPCARHRPGRQPRRADQPR